MYPTADQPICRFCKYNSKIPSTRQYVMKAKPGKTQTLTNFKVIGKVMPSSELSNKSDTLQTQLVP